MKQSAYFLVSLLLTLVVLVSFPQIRVVNGQDSSVFVGDDGSVEGTDRIQLEFLNQNFLDK